MSQHYEREIERAVDQLIVGNIIICPTDTIWGLSCDATNTDSVKKIFQLKDREASKPLIILVSDADMLRKYVEDVPENIEELLIHQDQPTTVVLDKPHNLPVELTAGKQTVAVRIVRDDFCRRVIKRLDRPVVSTSVNVSGEAAALTSADIDKSWEQKVDYIVNLPEHKATGQNSRIVRLQPDGSLETIRE